MVSDKPFPPFSMSETIGTDMASVVVTVDENYDLMNGLEICLGDRQSTNIQTFLLTLKRRAGLRHTTLT